MKCVIIGVAGGTGSGKSTFVKRLKDELGDDVSVILHDSYYKSRNGVPFEERKRINYDHPDALETDLLIRHIETLKAGEPVCCPVYDFTLHDRSGDTVIVRPNGIIIVEGILVLQDPRLYSLFDIKIYVEADADERILRRASRDMEERGRSFGDIMKQYLTTVKPMHYRYVEPTKAKADIVINSGMNDVALDLVKTKILVLQSRMGEAV